MNKPPPIYHRFTPRNGIFIYYWKRLEGQQFPLPVFGFKKAKKATLEGPGGSFEEVIPDEHWLKAGSYSSNFYSIESTGIEITEMSKMYGTVRVLDLWECDLDE